MRLTASCSLSSVFTNSSGLNYSVFVRIQNQSDAYPCLHNQLNPPPPGQVIADHVIRGVTAAKAARDAAATAAAATTTPAATAAAGKAAAPATADDDDTAVPKDKKRAGATKKGSEATKRSRRVAA